MFSLNMLCSGEVSVGVAYTEMLKVLTKGRPITFDLLDTLDGQAQLQSQGGSLTVEGLDGSADLQSQGGAIQVTMCTSHCASCELGVFEGWSVHHVPQHLSQALIFFSRLAFTSEQLTNGLQRQHKGCFQMVLFYFI